MAVHYNKRPYNKNASWYRCWSIIRTELIKPQLKGKVRRLEAYDGPQLTLLGSLTCDVEWNGSKYRQQQLAVVQSDKKIWATWERHTTPRRHQCSEWWKITCSQRIQSACETHIGITANVLQSQKDASTSSRQGQRKAWDNGTTGHPGASTTWLGHKCITSVAVEKMELWDYAWTWKFTLMENLWTKIIQS